MDLAAGHVHAEALVGADAEADVASPLHVVVELDGKAVVRTASDEPRGVAELSGLDVLGRHFRSAKRVGNDDGCSAIRFHVGHG